MQQYIQICHISMKGENKNGSNNFNESVVEWSTKRNYFRQVNLWTFILIERCRRIIEINRDFSLLNNTV